MAAPGVGGPPPGTAAPGSGGPPPQHSSTFPAQRHQAAAGLLPSTAAPSGSGSPPPHRNSIGGLLPSTEAAAAGLIPAPKRRQRGSSPAPKRQLWWASRVAVSLPGASGGACCSCSCSFPRFCVYLSGIDLCKLLPSSHGGTRGSSMHLCWVTDAAMDLLRQLNL
ncbi:hypothetical protein BS78_02G098600 [Paspalum vaginatum]|nr:hypothetical protein BS78_02G098600 [Paspalum vaginatum]